MRSTEIRTLLRRGPHPGRDTRRIHQLGRALARERLHLHERPARPRSGPDLLWDDAGQAYKVVTRTRAGDQAAITLDTRLSTDADHLVAVFLERDSFRLIEMVRIPWPMVMWLGRVERDRVRLRWAEHSPASNVAERL